MKTEEEIRECLAREEIVRKTVDYERWYFKGFKEALEWVLED